MTEAIDINVTRVERSKLKDINMDSLPFGKYFTDHMLEADYENGEWKNVEIKPYQPLLLEPSLAALHYGQSIFEGLKAYINDAGEVTMFRPYENLKRMNLSAERMNMPQITEEIFIDGLKQLIELDKQWIPKKQDHSLYIRPLMFATDAMLGVRPSLTYKFLIILSPVGAYFAEPMKILVEEKYTRAAPGGVGFAKNAGNYGGSLKAATDAKEHGYDQVLWTDAFEHKWLQEVGMMNVFFLINNVAITPSLEEGTILDGVTRSAVITLLREAGVKVEERKISINEVIDAYTNKTLTEIFGSGTAAVISYVREMKYRDTIIKFDINKYKVSPAIRQTLCDIQHGVGEDLHGWLVKL